MRGTLHSEWICDKKAIGLERHHIIRCKFTFTPELSSNPIMNDVYNRPPTNVTQKLRKTHIDVVFGASFAKYLHFLETNFRPRILQRDDDMASISKRAVCIYFSRELSFARGAAQVDGENGV